MSDIPLLISVKAHLDNVFGIVLVIDWVLKNHCFFDCAFKFHLEKMRPTDLTQIFLASLDMFNKHLSRIVRMTKFTLTCNTVFETFAEMLKFGQFCICFFDSYLLI